MSSDLDSYCDANRQRFVDELIEALRIPSISADPAHAADVRRNAEHFAAMARKAGFTSVEILETDGHPAVYAERIVSDSLPTALVYGHHDVQPVDPLDEWLSPPFEPQIRDGNLHARGAVDDKGQVFMHLKAVEAHLATRGELPVNIKLLIEGEEEIGSPNFDALVVRERARLTCDVAVVSDTAIYAEGHPSMCVGLRGLAIGEIEVSGPSLDLHSGVFGGAVLNPVEALARIMVSLKDPATGKVTIPGFYDAVVELTAGERDGIAALPFDEAVFRHEAGDIPAVSGEAGYTILEQRWARPTLEFNGIWGGYQGPGSKTIIPARAGVKISCRLVPNQDPADIAEKLRVALEAAVPAGVTAKIKTHAGGRPVLTSTDHPAVQAAARAITEVFGVEPLFTREGGSIPPVETFQRELGVPAILVGVGLPDDRIHAPNEKFDLEQYQRGIRVLAHFWDELAATLVATS